MQILAAWSKVGLPRTGFKCWILAPPLSWASPPLGRPSLCLPYSVLPALHPSLPSPTPHVSLARAALPRYRQPGKWCMEASTLWCISDTPGLTQVTYASPFQGLDCVLSALYIVVTLIKNYWQIVLSILLSI